MCVCLVPCVQLQVRPRPGNPLLQLQLQNPLLQLQLPQLQLPLLLPLLLPLQLPLQLA